MREMRCKAIVMTLAAMMAVPVTAVAQPESSFRQDGVKASLHTLGYDQASSFYLARGMPSALVERYARPCVIVVAIQNELSPTQISTRLEEWRAIPESGAAKQIRGRAAWLAELDQAKVTTAARMAFEWAQIPEEADLNAGDTIQGMLSLPLGRGEGFTLKVRWTTGGRGHEAASDTISCD